jgi:hypothetical protein
VPIPICNARAVMNNYIYTDVKAEVTHHLP